MRTNEIIETQFELPELKYDFNALEPFIDQTTMEIHYGKHHQGYVTKLNEAVKGTSLEIYDVEQLLREVSLHTTAVRNNAGGHYNHTLFWSILTPEPTEIKGELKNAINDTFGSLSNLKEEILNVSLARFGSGWAWLAVDPNGKLIIGSTPNQDNPIMDVADFRGEPILGIDLWEHAYYLTYQNKRAEYVNALWNIVDWEMVSENYNRVFDKYF